MPSTRLTCGFIFLVTFAVFSGAMDNDFVLWDDNRFVYDNPFITSLSLENLWAMVSTFQYSNWQPLAWLSHAIDYQLFGLHPAGHHLTSVLFHCWNTFWVFLIVREYLAFACKKDLDTRVLWQSALIAAFFFGLHPLRVESAVWVSERKDVLSTFLSFPVFLTYLRYVTAQDAKQKSFWMRISLVLFFLSLTAKPMPLMLPIILLLLDYYPFARWQKSSDLIPLIREKIPFFAMSLAIAVITLIAQKQIGAMVPLELIGFPRRIANAFQSLCMIYLEKSFWPVGLSPYYYYPRTHESLWISVFVFLAISWFCYKSWRKEKPLFAIAWLYFLITLLPVIGIVQVGEQAAADRYSYFPSLCMSFLVGAGIYSARHIRIMPQKIALHKIAVFAMSTVLVLFSTLTFKQVKVWEESINFWEQIGKSNPERGAWTLARRGNVLLLRGQVDEAIQLFVEGLKYRPNDFYLHFCLGTAYTLKKKYVEAETEYLKTMSIAPNSSSVYNALGKLYTTTGKLTLAEESLKKAIEITPRFPLAHINLGELYLTQNKLQLAEDEFNTALKDHPGSASAYDSLGTIYFKRKDYTKAEQYFQKAIEKDEIYFQAFAHLGELYTQTREIEKAEIAYRKVLEILPDWKEVQERITALRKTEIRAQQ
jgi:protein O-mannosyl-transferase